MGRRTKPRENYTHDAIVMRRTIDAINADKNSSSVWKEAVKEHLQAALRLFLEHEAGGTGTHVNAQG